MSHHNNQPIRYLLFAAFLGIFPAGAFSSIKVGDQFPSLAKADLAGGTLPATEGKVVMVDFCASWCAPCQASFPAYSKMYEALAPKGFVLVAVSVDQDPSAYRTFVAKFKPPFAVLRDARQQLVSEVNVPTMPTCYLIGRDGRVRYEHRGYHGEESEQTLLQEIETLLNAKSTS